MLTQKDKENILNTFPNIKLSYENITHKKVFNSDYIVAIPQGKKCFAWFTSINDKMVCLIMELSLNKQINNIKIMSACFSNELAYGTILYGTNFYNSNNNFFSIEDIFLYKGNEIERMCWGEKLIKINCMLKNDLKQVSYNSSFIVFGLPVMCKTNENFTKMIDKLEYKIETIQYKLFNRINNYLFISYKSYINDNSVEIKIEVNIPDSEVNVNNIPQIVKNEPKIHLNNEPKIHLNNEPKIHLNNAPKIENNIYKSYPKREITFLVKPDIQDDIYYIHCLNNELKEEEHGITHISDYNTSVMMNKLFRIIKENKNLDALEESDDEDEFENINIDKFVNLNKSHKMICQYNHKFKRWVPVKLANEENMIISTHELKYIYETHIQNRTNNKNKKTFTKNIAKPRRI